MAGNRVKLHNYRQVRVLYGQHPATPICLQSPIERQPSICVGATASRDAHGTHSLGRWLVNHAMKASKFIGSVNVKESSDEC